MCARAGIGNRFAGAAIERRRGQIPAAPKSQRPWSARAASAAELPGSGDNGGQHGDAGEYQADPDDPVE